MLNLSNYQCIIFDLDGTILDSTQVWAKVDMDFLGKRGIPVTKEYMQENQNTYIRIRFNIHETEI